jgi:hypothetical protein
MRVTPSSAATRLLATPSAARTTIRARWASRCSVVSIKRSVALWGETHRTPLGEAAWWLDPATLRARVSIATGEITYIAPRSVASPLGPSEQAVGRHFMDFVLPEARADASSLFDHVREAGEMHAQGQLRRGNGTTLPIEIRGVADGDSIDVAYRPVGSDEPSRSTISGMDGPSEAFGLPAPTAVAERHSEIPAVEHGLRAQDHQA